MDENLAITTSMVHCFQQRLAKKQKKQLRFKEQDSCFIVSKQGLKKSWFSFHSSKQSFKIGSIQRLESRNRKNRFETADSLQNSRFQPKL